MLINANEMTVKELFESILTTESDVVVVLFHGKSICFATNELARQLIIGAIAKRITEPTVKPQSDP